MYTILTTHKHTTYDLSHVYHLAHIPTMNKATTTMSMTITITTTYLSLYLLIGGALGEGNQYDPCRNISKLLSEQEDDYRFPIDNKKFYYYCSAQSISGLYDKNKVRYIYIERGSFSFFFHTTNTNIHKQQQQQTE